MPEIAQQAVAVSETIYGPEPIGAMQAGVLTQISIAGAEGRLNPVGDKRGPKGDPTRTAAGDLGPLQNFARVRSTRQPGNRSGSSTAMPSTKAGPSPSGSIQDRLGAMGI